MADGISPPTVDIRNRFFQKDIPFSREETREVEDEMVALMKVFSIEAQNKPRGLCFESTSK